MLYQQDKYRLVVELGHIMNQLKSGCVQYKLPLNMCSTQGVQPWGLVGWLYITWDNPACATMNKLSLGKQHKTVPEQNPFGVIPSGGAIFKSTPKLPQEYYILVLNKPM